ncbi:MAG TPA: hypothetical protein VF222_03605 [Nitrososphaeraceae archaeon]
MVGIHVLIVNLLLKERYNVNKHIDRKHPRSEIPSNLLSDSYQDTNSEYLRHRTEYTEKYLNQFKPLPPTYFNSWISNSNHATSISGSGLNTSRRKNNFYSTIREFLQYFQIIHNIQSKNSRIHRMNFNPANLILNLNSSPIDNNFRPYNSISNIGIENTVLFRIYRCKNCSLNIPSEFYGLDQIKSSSEDIHCILCRSQKQPQKQNSDLFNQKIMEWFRTNILSKVDDSKIYLKSINIPQDIYVKLKVERRPHFYYENDDSNIPPWLINLMLTEEFVDLGIIEEDKWAYRLTNSDEKSIEITRDELIEYLNCGNSTTFGLFKFQKNNITEYFFSYIQFERNLDTLEENNLSLID